MWILKNFLFAIKWREKRMGLVDLTRLSIPSNSNNAYYVDCKEDSITLKQLQNIIICVWNRECHMLNYLHDTSTNNIQPLSLSLQKRKRMGLGIWGGTSSPRRKKVFRELENTATRLKKETLKNMLNSYLAAAPEHEFQDLCRQAWKL